MTPEALFLTLLNRSLAVVWLVLALLLLRPFLRRVSRSFCCAMWGLVAFRLLCPFSIKSILSLIPSAEPIPTTIASPPVSSAAGVQTGGGIPAPFIPAADAVPSSVAPTPAQMYTRIAAVLWIIGAALLLLYALGSYLRLRLLTREAVRQADGSWLCDRIETPFVLGFFRPRILLPVTAEEGDLPYILAHERAHLARHDHWRKPIAFALLAVFWFQPALWVAYFLLRRDVEFACDERAIRKLGMELDSKKRYAKALLRGSSPRAAIAKLSCPLAFGGLQIKRRVTSVLTYKKPAFSLVMAALLVCLAVAVCFLTDPKGVTQVAETEVEAENAQSAAPPVEPSGGKLVGTSEKKPTNETPEEDEYPMYTIEEWMAMRDPSLASEEDWRFCYVLRHVRQWYPGTCGIFQNIGSETITLTIRREYKVPAGMTQEMVDAALRDPNISPPYDVIASDVVTVEIPAGETVSVPLDAELMSKNGSDGHWIYGGLCIIAGTYNGVSVTLD